MAKSKAAKRREVQPLPMASRPAKTLCCEDKYGITVRSRSRRCSRCPKVGRQR